MSQTNTNTGDEMVTPTSTTALEEQDRAKETLTANTAAITMMAITATPQH